MSLLQRIRADRDLAGLLVHPFDFDLDRPYWVGEDEGLRSGAPKEAVAGRASGCGYFFCGEGGEERPVLYLSSDGRTSLVAENLADLLTLVVAAPWWPECLGRWREGAAGMRAAHARLRVEDAEDYAPDLAGCQERVAAALGLDLSADVMGRLLAAARRTEPDFVLVHTEGHELDPIVPRGASAAAGTA
ncbi:hypothetical protein LG943_22310 [Streptomonospora sp. S1-112]|uniref:Uncharacterized protein n=1 Tax=Streptomonospora mangrovi TaxID=2883123 RepID=A0A9X3SJ64_9ACTN|nr:hypothetical protein [Streptomonospora mangrovi]MDA0567029.1 hypothetical protein [Streptomonospora mangrovi]